MSLSGDYSPSVDVQFLVHMVSGKYFLFGYVEPKGNYADVNRGRCFHVWLHLSLFTLSIYLPI